MGIEGFATYVIRYDPKDEEFKVVAGDTSNVSETDVYFENEITLAEELAASLTNFNLKGKIDIKQCSNCRKYFYAGKAEKRPFAKRCRVCRKKV